MLEECNDDDKQVYRFDRCVDNITLPESYQNAVDILVKHVKELKEKNKTETEKTQKNLKECEEKRELYYKQVADINVEKNECRTELAELKDKQVANPKDVNVEMKGGRKRRK